MAASNDILVTVNPQQSGNTALVVIIVLIIVVLVAVAAGCYYRHFIAGKPKTEDVEIAAVGGAANVDVEAAGAVKAKGEFSAIPLDSARTDASGNAKIEVTAGVKTN